MIENNYELRNALNIIFNHIDEVSYWDHKNHRIRPKLIFDTDWNWKVSSDSSDRYGFFTLFTILLAKEQFGLDTRLYDEKITLYLNYIKRRIKLLSKSDVTYGAFNSLVLGQILYDNLDFEEEISYCMEYLTTNIHKINDNQDTLLLIGICLYLYKIKFNKNLSNYLEKLVINLINSQDKNGIFQTGDLRAPYHQRLMYTIWACSIVSDKFFPEKISKAIEKTIDFVWNHRREKVDNAFLWHAPIYLVRSKFLASVPIVSVKSSKYLFSCHQNFFVNAINLYNKAFNEKKYRQEKELAMEWIFGNNRINKNLVKTSRIDIPIRIMKTDGNLFVKNNNFIGSYEIGSHILALAGNNYFDNY